MFLIEITATVRAERRLTDDEITDMIETVVDDLDRLSTEPSVGTARTAGGLDMTVSMTVDEHEEWDALSRGVSAVRAAFHAAGIGTAGLVARSHLAPLQPA